MFLCDAFYRRLPSPKSKSSSASYNSRDLITRLLLHKVLLSCFCRNHFLIEHPNLSKDGLNCIDFRIFSGSVVRSEKQA